jgi:DNA-binding CsgD family transcriptional regulator
MNVFPNVSPREKLLLRRFAARKSDREIAADLGDTESRIAAQRQRLVEKFEIRTHEQLVAFASQLARWPYRNSQKLKASGGRKHRVRPPIDVNEIKKMKGDGIGATDIAKALNISRTSVYTALVSQPAIAPDRAVGPFGTGKS